MLFDGQGLCLMANRTGQQLLGLAADDLVGRAFREFWPEEERPVVDAAVRRVQAGEQVSFDGWRGTELCPSWWRVILHPVRGEGEGVRQFVAIGTDVTERRLGELALAASEENLRITLDSIDEGVIVTDAAGTVTRANPVAAALTGWGREEAPGAPLSAVFPLVGQDGRELGIDPARLAMSSGQVARWTGRELLLRGRDGGLRRVVLSSAPIRSPQGGTVGAVLAFRDVTEQIQTEERLRHSQKMQAIGQLAGGVAHDFNNMLSGILGFAQLIVERAVDPERCRGYARRIVDSADRAAALTAKLLSFSRRGRVESVAVDVHAAIEDTLGLLERSIDRRIALERRLGCRRPTVSGDPAELQSALLNLCLNARDAMPAGGVLCVETREVDLREERCSGSSFEITPGAYVQITVSDTGVGMGPEIVGRIFEPFFTTKGPGCGTGLGLAAVYGTVKEHRGEIVVESRPGEGTHFRVLLPLAHAVAAPLPSAAAAPAGGGRGCILVVDDEEVVRECMSLMLQGLGYRVRQAPDGLAGLETYRRHGEEIDGVIMDLMMPRMGGRECFEALRRLDPGVRVVLTSGFSGDETLETLAGEGLVDFLRKPVRAAELARAAALLRPGGDRDQGRGGRREPAAPAAAYNGRR